MELYVSDTLRKPALCVSVQKRLDSYTAFRCANFNDNL